MSSIPREIDGNKFVGENLAGVFFASLYFSGSFQVSNSELLRDTIFKFAAF